MKAELAWTAPEIVQAQRAEAGLLPDPSIPPFKSWQDGLIEKLFYCSPGENDELARWALQSSTFDNLQKTRILQAYFESALKPQEIIDEKRAGEFLKEAVFLYNDKSATLEVKKQLEKLFTGELLEDILEECAIERWPEESTEAALHAYCAFNSFEKIFGHAMAQELYRELTKTVITARLYDESLEVSASQASRSEDGTVIYLGTRGADVAQVIIQNAFLFACAEIKATPVYAPYYRDHIATTSLRGSSSDPDSNLMTMSETMADLCRVDGSTRPTGVELPVKGKVNKNGQITIFHSVANVGGHILPASGYAEALRLHAIRRRGIKYDGPKTADAFRDIQIDSTDAVIAISLGDGAYMHLLEALEMQMANRLPVVNIIQNNGVAIGTSQNEVLAQCELWKKGHGKGIPGVRVSKDDLVGLWMAIHFATKRALLDAGPVIVEAMVTRLLPHSIQHGDHITSGYLIKVQEIIQKYHENLPAGSLAKAISKNLLEDDLTLVSNTKNQIALKAWLEKTCSKKILGAGLESQLHAISREMLDPFEACLSQWKKAGYITDVQIQEWTKSAQVTVKKNLDEVLQRPGPNPKDALKFFKMPQICLPTLPHSRQRVSMSGITALNQAQKESMEQDPNVLVRGVDVYKGYDYKDGIGIQVGGYYHQQDGLFELFAHEPARVHNMPICENTDTAYLLGLSTTRADEESLKNSFRVLVDFQYADYGIQCKEALHVLGRICYTTGGQLTRRLGILLPSGAVAGGGTMHSGEYDLDAVSSPLSTNVYYTSDPETTYKLLRYCMLYENNPYIFMVDKGILTKNHIREFELGTGFLEPGRARVVRPGGDTQYLSYGPMVNKIEAALKKRLPSEHIGLLDLYSLRPFPREDLKNFLKSGEGPIKVVHESPTDQSFGSYIIDQLISNPELAEVVGTRSICHIGARSAPAVPCAGTLMKRVIPQVEDFL